MSEMTEVKTADLTGLALDYAAGIADGRELELPGAVRGRKGLVWCDPFVIRLEGRPDFHDKTRRKWSPSTDWSQCGPLIEKIKIGFGPVRGGWVAHPHRPNAPTNWLTAEEPLVAICRAIVADKFGMVVSVPAELI